MTKKLIILFSLLTSLFFNSCSIQKRVHTNGYHINWNNNYKCSKDSNKDELLTENKATYISEDEIEQTPVKTEKVSKPCINPTANSFIDQVTEEPTNNDLIRKSARKKDKRQHLKNKSTYSLKKSIKTQNKKNPEAKINGFGLTSFILGALSVFLFFTGILGLVFAVISLRQFKNNPGKYSNKWMAIVGLIIGEIVCAACIILSLVLAILGGVFFLYIGLIFLMAIIASLVIVNLPARSY